MRHIPDIRIVGVGGAGVVALSTMATRRLRGVEFIAFDSDSASLENTTAAKRVQIGRKATRGVGARGDVDVGRRAAEESRLEIRSALKGADVVVVTAGMGGGTGTAATQVVAELAREIGALPIEIVTTPFPTESPNRLRFAEEALSLRILDETVLAIANSHLESTTVGTLDAYLSSRRTVSKAVSAISELLLQFQSHVDLHDVRSLLSKPGLARTGSGFAFGADRATRAMREALKAVSLAGLRPSQTQGLLLSIRASRDIMLSEVHESISMAQDWTSADADIIFGSFIDETMQEGVEVTLIATGHPRLHEGLTSDVLGLRAQPLELRSSPPAPAEYDKERLASELKELSAPVRNAAWALLRASVRAALPLDGEPPMTDVRPGLTTLEELLRPFHSDLDALQTNARDDIEAEQSAQRMVRNVTRALTRSLSGKLAIFPFGMILLDEHGVVLELRPVEPSVASAVTY